MMQIRQSNSKVPMEKLGNEKGKHYKSCLLPIVKSDIPSFF